MTVERTKTYLLRLLLAVFVVGAWLYVTGPAEVAEIVVPPIPKVWTSLGELVVSASFWNQLGVTVGEIAIAALVTCVLGVAFGFWASRSVVRRNVCESLVSWGYMTPFVLFYPIFIVILGVGVSSKLAFAVTASFFPVAYTSVRGFANVDPKFLRMGEAFGASKSQLDLLLKFRAGMPMVRSGLRIGIATSMIMVILGEMLGSTQGIGYMIAKASGTLGASQNYALIVVVLLVALALQATLKRLLPSEENG